MDKMGKTKPSFYPLMEQYAENENRFSKESVNNQETTLSTVLMTQHLDTRMQLKFHRLLLISEDNSVAKTHPLNRKLIYVGRSRRNHILITDPQVSVKHLSVSVKGNSCVINDLNSSNGTFINGERLVGGQVLSDGDEIMIGKTILRFAARQHNDTKMMDLPSDRILPNRKRTFFKGRNIIPAAAALCFVMAFAFFLFKNRGALGLNDVTPSIPDQLKISSSWHDSQIEKRPSMSMASQKDGEEFNSKPAPTGFSYIQQALDDYAIGHLNIAIQTLKRLSVLKENTPDAWQAKQTLSLFDFVRELYAEALQAEEHKAYADAIDCWDRLLTVDLELIGNRPSFFATQAEQKVQKLSYEYARESYGLKNNEKARQLCHVILQINPSHQGALSLLAKINQKA